MRLNVFLTTLLFNFVLKVAALSLFEKALIIHDFPLCATLCSARVAKKLGVRYLDGRGNCARPDYQYRWKQCLKNGCFREDRQKAIGIMSELCDGYGINPWAMPKIPFDTNEVEKIEAKQ